jgi:hypothetical protein
MSEKKSILEEALLDIKNIEKALNNNTKEILRSVAKEEIDTVVKESLSNKMEEEMYEEEEMSNEGEEIHEEGMDGDDSLNEIDLTSASDDDIISVYKKLTGDDEIEIVDGDIHISVSEPGEYIIKTSQIDGLDDESEMEDMDDMDDMEDETEMDNMDDMDDMDDEPEMDDMDDVDDEPEYEIEMGDEEEEEDEEEEVVSEEEEIDEVILKGEGMSVGGKVNKTATGSTGQPKGAGAKNESVIAKKIVAETAKKYNALLDESKKLKAENEQFRVALKEFRTKLVETVVFNSNLTYVTKLFTEHSTSKSEKENIIKRFDNEVTNLKESKRLYKTILNELDVRKPINESVENKIIKGVTTGASKQLTESTAYVDPSTQRIIDLINRVEKK